LAVQCPNCGSDKTVMESGSAKLYTCSECNQIFVEGKGKSDMIRMTSRAQRKIDEVVDDSDIDPIYS